MTSRHQESGSFKRPGAVYSRWLFVDLWGSSTSLDTIWSNGVPGYAAPVSTDSLRCLPVGDTSHQWSAVSAERECLAREASGSDSPWQLVSACAKAGCCGPSCRDHTDNIVRPPPDLLRHWCQKWGLIHVRGGRFWSVSCDPERWRSLSLFVNIAELSAVNSPTRRLWRLDYMSTGLPVAIWIY